MKKIFLATAVLGLALAATSCHQHYDPSTTIEPPTVEVAPSTVAGVVVDILGNPVADAVVKYDNEKTVSTDSKGEYIISGITNGLHTLTIQKDGFDILTKTLNVQDAAGASINMVINAMLQQTEKYEVAVAADATTVKDVTTSAIPDNKEGKIDIALEVPAKAFETRAGNTASDVKVSITPVYAASALTRAGAEDMVLGSTISCNADVKIVNPIDVTFKVDESIKEVAEIMQLTDGQWTKADYSNTAEGVVVHASEFTTYGIFVPMHVSIKKSAAQNLLIQQDAAWNNVYGELPIYISNVDYTYEAGNALTASATNNLEGLLVERLAREYGLVLTPMSGTFAVNQTFPVGTGFELLATQETGTITLEVGTRTRAVRTVTAKTYGTVTLKPKTFSRDHNGGGSIQ